MCLRKVVLMLAVLLCWPNLGFSQAVAAKNGNIWYTSKTGKTIQFTTSGLDSDPNLSPDGRLVVFVRRTPALLIDTGVGEQDRNELWVASVSGTEAPRRVLVGHPGGGNVGKDLLLAGFSNPQFSMNGQRIYFVSEVWATSKAIQVLEINSGDVKFLYDGGSVEVIRSGSYAGYLIAYKQIPRVVAGRVFRYWLLDPDGNDVAEIGETMGDMEVFKQMNNLEIPR